MPGYNRSSPEYRVPHKAFGLVRFFCENSVNGELLAIAFSMPSIGTTFALARPMPARGGGYSPTQFELVVNILLTTNLNREVRSGVVNLTLTCKASFRAGLVCV